MSKEDRYKYEQTECYECEKILSHSYYDTHVQHLCKECARSEAFKRVENKDKKSIEEVEAEIFGWLDIWVHYLNT